MTQHTTIAALYHFSDSSITDIEDKQNKLKMTGEQHQIKGTLLLAPEGINGTIAGKQEDIEAMLKAIESALSIQKLIWKKALFDSNPFYRFKVKIKKEIVTLGKNSQNVSKDPAYHLINGTNSSMIEKPLSLTRETTKTAIGTFPNAIDPQTKNFGTSDFVSQHLSDARIKKLRCVQAVFVVRKLQIIYSIKVTGGLPTTRWHSSVFRRHERRRKPWRRVFCLLTGYR